MRTYDSEPAELVIRARKLGELFCEREFDPFSDDSNAIWSVVQIAQLSDATSKLARMRLRVLLPADEIEPDAQTRVETAIGRYCARQVAQSQSEMAAWRRVALTAFLWGLGFFAISLALTAGVQHAPFLPEAIRTLVVETLVIAGWIVMWQPMDDLIAGWVPIREKERRFRTIGSMPVSVEPIARST